MSIRPSTLLFLGRTSLSFLIRSEKSTIFLSIMVISAVAALIFLSSLAVGVHDAMLRNTVGLFTGNIFGYNISDSISTSEIQGDGISTVLKRKYVSGVLQNGKLSRPISLCFLDTDEERAVTAFHTRISQGRYPQMGDREILLSQSIANELGVEIGDRLQFGNGLGKSLTLSGIYKTSMDSFDWKTAFAPLDIAPASSTTWSAAIFLDLGESTQDTLNTLKTTWGENITFNSWETNMPDLRQLIDLEYVSMGIVILLVFGVVAIGISCSFIIFIVRNIREYGIMKAMGVTNFELALLIIIKVVMMNVAACSVGLILGCLGVAIVNFMGGIDISAFTSHNQYFSVSGIIIPRLTSFSLYTPPVTALVFSILASLWPAILVAKKRTAEILRSI